MVMYKFNEYVLRRDEANLNLFHKIPYMAQNPESGFWNKLGAAAGLPVAAASGLVPTTAGIINVMRDTKSRAFSAAYIILHYLQDKPDLRNQLLNVIEDVVKKLESGSHMGVINPDQAARLRRSRGLSVGGHQGDIPTVDSEGGHSTFGEIGAAIWSGIATSTTNIFDTILGKTNKITTKNDVATIKFREAYRIFFQQLGKLPSSKALPLLKNFELALTNGVHLDNDIWK